MRYLFIGEDGILDTQTGVVYDCLTDGLLKSGSGGVIAGRNLYPVICSVVNQSFPSDGGWSARIHTQRQPKGQNRVHGIIYYSQISYRFNKTIISGKRIRPRSIKWIVLNLELFSETREIQQAAEALVKLCECRGIRTKYSPSSLGVSLVKQSPHWTKDRRPAPRFVSERARESLPGNFYSTRWKFKSATTALYLDQQSSHHVVASTIRLPHPHGLRARGRFRAVESGRFPNWLDSTALLDLHKHVGVIVATVLCEKIPDYRKHLYPRWCHKPGLQNVWLWTPELRLLDKYTTLIHVSASLTSNMDDDVLDEYSRWCLLQLKNGHKVIKSSLLAAYGMLAVRNQESMIMYSVHSRNCNKNTDIVSLPLLEIPVYRTTIRRKFTPTIQNVVARGVIESETMVRSLELARWLEADGKRVLQVYADGLVVHETDLPLMPTYWRVAGELHNVQAPPSAHSIVSSNLIKLPGIPNGRRTSVFTNVA